MNKLEGMYIGRELDPNFEELVFVDLGRDEDPIADIRVHRRFSLRDQETAGIMREYQTFYIDELLAAADDFFYDYEE